MVVAINLHFVAMTKAPSFETYHGNFYFSRKNFQKQKHFKNSQTLIRLGHTRFRFAQLEIACVFGLGMLPDIQTHEKIALQVVWKKS